MRTQIAFCCCGLYGFSIYIHTYCLSRNSCRILCTALNFYDTFLHGGSKNCYYDWNEYHISINEIVRQRLPKMSSIGKGCGVNISEPNTESCGTTQFNIVSCEFSSSTHWGRVTHICVNSIAIIGSDNGLSPGRRLAIIWTNSGILLIWPLGTNFSEISIDIQAFSFKKIHFKMSSGKWRPFCLGFNVLSKPHLYKSTSLRQPKIHYGQPREKQNLNLKELTWLT